MRIFDVEVQQFSGEGYTPTNMFVVASTRWQARKEAASIFFGANAVDVIENWSANVEQDHTGAWIICTTGDQ
mgnify:CR=1 FL=1